LQQQELGAFEEDQISLSARFKDDIRNDQCQIIAFASFQTQTQLNPALGLVRMLVNILGN
jgi:hypothetical protein